MAGLGLALLLTPKLDTGAGASSGAGAGGRLGRAGSLLTVLTLVSVSPPGRSGEGLAAGCGWPLLHPLPAADGGAEAGIYRYHDVCDH